MIKTYFSLILAAFLIPTAANISKVENLVKSPEIASNLKLSLETMEETKKEAEEIGFDISPLTDQVENYFDILDNLGIEYK